MCREFTMPCHHGSDIESLTFFGPQQTTQFEKEVRQVRFFDFVILRYFSHKEENFIC
jgi:hypothetical protein